MMPVKGVKSITTKELQALLEDEENVFVDVRSEREYKNLHIPQFKNMPIGADLTTLPKDKPIIVICQSGIRSNKACRQLVKLGYTDVTNIRRGMNDFRKS